MPYLIMSKDSKGYRVFRFSNALKMGRADSNDVVLNDEDDLAISRHHAYIEQIDSSHVLHDRSKNGTFVDRSPIDWWRLSHGTVFRIENYHFTFVDDSAAESIAQKIGDLGFAVEDEDPGVETLVPVGRGLAGEPDEDTELKNRLFSEGIVVQNKNMFDLYRDVQAIAGINVPVLIVGEPGTGKEHVAHALHNYSKATGNLIALNCSSIPEGLFESELFGCVKGAFNNATDKPGKLELAKNGTIFLDEIGDMNLSLQPKLLRFIEDKKVTRLGDTKTTEINLRVLAATNQDLNAMMKRGAFREDFYQRLACIKLEVPPLRKRKDDIPHLAEFLLSRFSKKYHWKTPRISANAMKMLIQYDWPGNVRQLKNILLSALVHVRGKTIFPRDLSAVSEELQAMGIRPGKAFLSLEDMERRHLVEALEQADFNKTEAARLLGISRDTLYKKIKKYKVASKPTRRNP